MSDEGLEVYIGNGETIQVTPSKVVRYYLDIARIEKFFEENPDGEAEVGAVGDWFWTARTLTKRDFQEVKEFRDYLLRSSDWSHFSLNGEDCTIDMPIEFARLAFNDGFECGIWKIERWLSGIYNGVLRRGTYEVLKDFVAEVEPIIKKYKDKIDTLEQYGPKREIAVADGGKT